MSMKDGAPEGGDSEMESCLQLDLHTDEAVWMRQIGHLKDWCAQASRVHLGVPALVSTPLAADSIRLLFLFRSLQHLDITFNSSRSRIEQPVLVACAELLNLTTLRLGGGHLDARGLDLGVLTSLRHLHTLSVRPHSDEQLDGLEDEHLATVARLTGLRSLSLRASENVTDEGVGALTALTGLTQLSLVPMGLWVTREGISALSAAMPALALLSVGLHESRQVAALKGLADREPAAASGAGSDSGSGAVGGRRGPPSIRVVLNSPEVSTSGFFSTLTLVLRPSLVSLRMATVESTDAAFLLAVGTLVHLTELKMGVSLPEGGQPFTCNLAALSSLGRLQTLEFAVTQELRLPLSVKLVSMLSLSWPQLRSLSLSVMAKPEVVPEALDLLDNFHHLTSLSLFAPLDYSCDEEAERILLPVTPRYLPSGLTHLVLECAELRDACTPLAQTTSAEGAPAASQPESQPQPPANGAVGSGPQLAAPSPPPAGSGGEQQHQPRPVLPHLQHLELTSCHAGNDHLTWLLHSATGVRHLELSDIRGITDAALRALRGLTRLEHLVVRLTETKTPAPALSTSSTTAMTAAPARSGAKAPDGGGGASGGGGGGVPAVSHKALSALRDKGTLRHLEWSLAEPLGAAALQEACAGVLSTLGGLQELSLDVVPELRAEDRHATAAASGRRSAAAGSEPGGAGSEGGEAGEAARWRERLQKVLPLCTVADRPGIVLYDLWNDRTLQVVDS